MIERLELGETVVDVFKKDIKNLHLSVYPPTGRVRISAPSRMSLDTIRIFAISKLGWIKKQQKRLRQQERETPREHIDNESHFVWGKRYLLRLIESDEPAAVELQQETMVLRVQPGSSGKKKHAIVEEWYRTQIRNAVPSLISKWEPRLGVKVNQTFVQKMKTKWGSCNMRTRNIRLNTDLAKKPIECLEYVVIHEMVHLIERKHSARFKALLERFVPKWKFYRDSLNQLPVRHEKWAY